MLFKKFRIKNYKSIIDSLDCYLDSEITILAGKNESGKTSILEAIQDFNIDRKINSKVIPVQDQNKIPQITLDFLVDGDNIIEIMKEIEFDYTPTGKELNIIITKKYPDQYSLESETEKILGFTNYMKFASKKIKDIEKQYEVLQDLNSTQINRNIIMNDIEFKQENLNGIKNELQQIYTKLKPHVPNINLTPQFDINLFFENTFSTLTRIENKNYYSQKFIEKFLEYVPNFILFNSFEDVFPNMITLDNLEENDWIQDLSIISNLDVQIIKSEDDRGKATHKNKLNIKINNDYKNFWAQDLSNLEIDWDNEKLMFWVKENGHYFAPEDRSKGKQWHLAFYIKVTARASEDQENVILIDEPGLYLHAKAQRDILKKLEDAAVHSRIIFSTHSPYLLEPDKLERIRLVQKCDKIGSYVENKIHKVSDKETLTPILTAIGLEMIDGINQVEKKNNVIVEGPSDFYYLCAFKNLNQETELNFIYGGGAGNMPNIGTILQGWGCNVIYLYDNDKAYRNAQKNIKKHWLTITSELIRKLQIDGSIEDILSKEDYKKYVLNNPSIKLNARNSEYAKDGGRDKVLDAKKFLELMKNEKITLSSNSLKQINELIKLLKDAMKIYNKN